ncbi:hypothetical protein MTR_3g116930 [Medicago truncatula]|uniref:Uncharacterized protein n=1 Tax=Medicago truncatula TaxID=3880 RepID=G7J750_MEDTR|nr:hypothetical protein MTR_3g116930 [Medicago truncatula]
MRVRRHKESNLNHISERQEKMEVSEKSHDSPESETNEFLKVDALLQFLVSSKPSSVEEISMSFKI